MKTLTVSGHNLLQTAAEPLPSAAAPRSATYLSSFPPSASPTVSAVITPVIPIVKHDTMAAIDTATLFYVFFTLIHSPSPPTEHPMQNADITMSKTAWAPIGTESYPFTGQYNGNGYEIKGLTMTSPTVKIIGFFQIYLQ